jgi:hypothetical protein
LIRKFVTILDLDQAVGDWSLDCTLNISSEHKVMTIWMQYISFNHFGADNSVLAKQKTNPE